MGSSERKSAFLGMPHSTANHQLRKSILFKYVSLAGEDNCYKCGNKIESVNDLSIEHKEPWEGRSVDLFWDLDNIAFSHIQCNKPHTYKKPAIPYEQGVQKCYVCNVVKPFKDFYKSSNNGSGRQRHCKTCHKNWRKSKGL